MSKKYYKSGSEDECYSDSLELIDDLFSETNNDAPEKADGQSDLLGNSCSEKTDEQEVHTGDLGRVLITAEGKDAPGEDRSILESDVKDVAARFWNYLKKDSKDTFLDADIKDVSRAVINFLGQDIVGKKIVVLDDEILRTANIAARILKRKRRLVKDEKQQSTIARVKEIYKYLHNPFWQDNMIIEKSRNYLENNIRRITPSVLQGLNDIVERLEIYFDGNNLDYNIFSNDIALKRISMDLGYKQFAVCQRQKQALAMNRSGDIFCINTDVCKAKCLFNAGRAHGEEKEFLTSLGEMLTKKGMITE
jgi:hypothetical protein